MSKLSGSRPTDDEIFDQIDKTIEAQESGRSKWSAMSYEQGVDNALRWAIGETDEPPIEDE